MICQARGTVCVFERDPLIRDSRSADKHQGQWSYVPQQKAEDMTAPDQFAASNFTLDPRAPSRHDSAIKLQSDPGIVAYAAIGMFFVFGGEHLFLRGKKGR